MPERADAHGGLEIHGRHVANRHGQEDHAFVQRLVVLQVMHEDRRHVVFVSGRHEDAGARHADGWPRGDLCQKHVDRAARASERTAHELSARVPRGHDCVDHGSNQQREPAAVRDLDHVRAEEQQVHHEKGAADEGCARDAPSPQPAGDGVRQHRRDHHRRRHGHAVRCGEIRGRLEAEHETHRRDHEHRIDFRDVDLAVLLRRGVLNVEARRVSELHRLLRQRERAGDDRLRRDHGGHRRKRDERIQAATWHERIKRIHAC